MRRSPGVMVLGLTLSAALVACTASESHLERIKARKKLIAITFPQQDNPFTSVNLERGPMKKVGTAEDFTGIDIEIMNAFALSIGVVLEIKTVSQPSYGELIPDLLRGEGDVVMASFNITPEREEIVDYARSYFVATRQVLVRQESPIASIDDFEDTTGAMVEGSSQLKYIEDLVIPNLRIFPTAFTRDAMLMVRDGEADFSITDSPNATKFAREIPDLKIAFNLPGEQPYGFAVPKGSDLRDELSAFVEAIENDGTLQAIVEKFLPPVE